MLPSAISRVAGGQRNAGKPGRGLLGLSMVQMALLGALALGVLLMLAAALTMGVTPAVATVVTELPQG